MELWKDSVGKMPPSDRVRWHSVDIGLPRFAFRGEQVYIRLNSVPQACSLFESEGQGTGFREPFTVDEPWESGPEVHPGTNKSSEVMATGLSKLECSDKSEN